MNRLFPDAGGDSPDLFRASGRGAVDEFAHVLRSYRLAFPGDDEPEQTLRYLAGLEMGDGGRLGFARLQSAIRFAAHLSTSPLYLEATVLHWIKSGRFG